MPLHSIQSLSPGAVLGLWHLTETPAELWAQLAHSEVYQALVPVTPIATRQAQWLCGRVLVHRLLREFDLPQLAGATVQNDATGRPHLSGATAVVSLSHSGMWVAAVLALDGRVGVDIEMVRDKAQRLASKFLADDEWAAAHQVAQQVPTRADAHYTLLWSAKETLYKLAARPGLLFKSQLRLDFFTPRPAGEINSTLVINNLHTRHCICYTQPAPGYVLTYSYEPRA